MRDSTVVFAFSVSLVALVLAGVSAAVTHDEVLRLEQAQPPAFMTSGEAAARAADLTGRLMACFGDSGGWQCRPVGQSQTDNPDKFIGPVVTCFGGHCRQAPVPVTAHEIPVVRSWGQYTITTSSGSVPQ